jgi:hypothetical protein
MSTGDVSQTNAKGTLIYFAECRKPGAFQKTGRPGNHRREFKTKNSSKSAFYSVLVPFFWPLRGEYVFFWRIRYTLGVSFIPHAHDWPRSPALPLRTPLVSVELKRNYVIFILLIDKIPLLECHKIWSFCFETQAEERMSGVLLLKKLVMK